MSLPESSTNTYVATDRIFFTGSIVEVGQRIVIEPDYSISTVASQTTQLFDLKVYYTLTTELDLSKNFAVVFYAPAPDQNYKGVYGYTLQQKSSITANFVSYTTATDGVTTAVGIAGTGHLSKDDISDPTIERDKFSFVTSAIKKVLLQGDTILITFKNMKNPDNTKPVQGF